MKIDSILESVKRVEEAIVPAKDAKPTAAPAKRTMNPQPGVRSRIEPTKPAAKIQKKTGSFAAKQDVKEAEVEESGLQAYLGKKKYGEEGMKALQKAGREGASKEKMAKIRAKHDKMDEQVEEARDLPGNQERIDVAEPKGKITGADFKALRAKKKDKVEEAEVEEAVKHTKTGRIHKAEPGGYGRKEYDGDKDDEGKKVKPVVKKGRGRPKKHADSDTGHAPTYDFAKDLQSFMVGSIPASHYVDKTKKKQKGLAALSGKKHKLKDWIEHVQAEMIAESAQIAEVALDPSQLAVPKVAGTGTAATAAQTAAKPGQQMGAAVVDFKNPQDPLKAALQKAVQQKQVSVLGEDDSEKFEDMSDKELIRHCKQQGIEKSCNIDTDGDLVNREEIIDLLKQHTKDDDKVDERKMTGAEKSKEERLKAKYDDSGMKASMKKQYGADKGEDVYFATLRKKAMSESAESTGETLLEGYTFEELIGRFPHEHKMCQEGWGMDENMYEALCDHYFREGRIPYKVWHGPLEELRKHVEECYMEDTHAMEGFKPTDSTGDRHRQLYPGTTKPFAHKPAVTQTPAKTPFSVDPIAAVTDRAYDAGAKLAGAVKSKLGMREDDMAESALERSLRQSAEGMAEGLAEDKSMTKNTDIQMESWEAQLERMLAEDAENMPNPAPEKIDECGDEPAAMDGNDIVRALAALLGMAPKSSPMSVAGDDGAHAIEVIPVAPGDVQDQLAQDQQTDTSGGDLDFIKRMLGARMGPDYAEERAMEGQTQTASPGDAHMSPLSKVEEDEVEEGNKFTGNLAKARAAGKKMADLDGDGDMEKVQYEDAQSEEDAVALSSEADRDAALATAYAADDHTNDDKNMAVSEGSDHCPDCGSVMEADHVCESNHEEELNEWANSPAGKSEDEQFQTEMDFMTKMISGGLNNIKRDQTVLPSTQVVTREETTDAEFSIAEQLRKLAGIN